MHVDRVAVAGDAGVAAADVARDPPDRARRQGRVLRVRRGVPGAGALALALPAPQVGAARAPCRAVLERGLDDQVELRAARVGTEVLGAKREGGRGIDTD